MSSLFELSKAANDAATATINFYNKAKEESGSEFEFPIELASALQTISAFATVPEAPKVVEETSEPAPKKRRVSIDPHAPKKPLTMFFAFSAYARSYIKSKRDELGLEPLQNQAMSKEISEKWNSLPESEKAKWKKAYEQEMLIYQEEKNRYTSAKRDDPQVDFSDMTHDYTVKSKIDPYLPEEAYEREKKKAEKKLKKKSKKDSFSQNE